MDNCIDNYKKENVNGTINYNLCRKSNKNSSKKLFLNENKWLLYNLKGIE